MSAALALFRRWPWLLSYVGAVLVWLGAVAYTGGFGAGAMIQTALSLSVFAVVVGVGQMFVVTLGPGNVDLSLPANIGLASAAARPSATRRSSRWASQRRWRRASPSASLTTY